MSKQKGAGRTAAATVETADRPEKIRNVALVGHSAAGKTTLVEALLAATGTIPRAGTVADGSTVSDHDPVETAQQRSVALSVCPLSWSGVSINLLDTPGYPDFTGELRAGLRAADAALFVVSAADAIDPITVSVWEECAALGTPRAVVISKLDAPRADYAATVATCQQVFGGADGQDVLPLYLPDGDTALVGLLSEQRFDYAGGFPPSATTVTGGIDDARGALIEAIINNSEDETLLDRYLAGESIDLEVLIDDLETAVARGTFFPVLPVCAGTGLGLAEVLELLVGGFPSPVERPLPDSQPLYGIDTKVTGCDAAGPLLAEIVRTSVDQYLGRLSVLRLFSGTLTPETAIHVSGHGGAERGHPDHDSDERVAQLFSPLGAALRPIDRAVAGDICAVGRLAGAETGDTISAKTAPLLIDPWPMPEPLLPIAVQAATRADEDALAKAMSRLTAGDPTVRVERADTGQLVLWCMGDAHADVVLDRLRATGAHVDTVPLRVGLQETFVREAPGHGRLVKQSGGHGQYAVCDVTVAPLPRGAGVQFAQKVVGGAVPSQFIGSVEKGVRTQLAQGLGQDHIPVVDVLVTLLDGKSHSVDSSDAAFQTAGSLAVKDAAAGGGATSLLEPVAAVDIVVPDAHVGPVLSDLSGRRGRVTGTEPDSTAMAGMERTVVHAEIPDAELVRYATSLRSLTAGTGRFTRHFARYDVVPDGVADTLRAPVTA